MRYFRFTCLFVSTLFISATVLAQRTCGKDSVHAHMMGLPGYAKWHQERTDEVSDALASGNRDDCDAPLIVPVAVHFQNTVYNYRLTYKWGTEDGISINTEAQRGWISVLR